MQAGGQDPAEATLQEIKSFTTSLEGTRRSPTAENLSHTFALLSQHLEKSPHLALSLKPVEIYWDDKSVYANKFPKESLSYQLYDGGLRQIRFRSGISAQEFGEIVKLLSLNLNQGDTLDLDYYSLFVERLFDHFDVTGDDLLHEAVRKDPALREVLKAFASRQRRSDVSPRVQPRQLKDKDLQTIQESKLNARLLMDPPPHLDNLRLAILETHNSRTQSDEHRERLLQMGLYFLNDHESPERAQVGRGIISQVCVMMLEAGRLEKFISILEDFKAQQASTTEDDDTFSEALDSVFDPHHAEIYKGAFQNPELAQRLTTAMVNVAPSSVLRLVVKILSDTPTLLPALTPLLIKNIPLEVEWLSAQILEQPQNPFWIQLLDFGRKNQITELQSLVLDLARSMPLRLREPTYRYLARVATPDALKFFKQKLEAKDTSSPDRIQLYQILSASLSKTKFSMRILKNHFESEVFKTLPMADRTAGLECLARLAGEIAQPFFWQLWSETGQGGVFQKKSALEAQRVILTALYHGCHALYRRLLTDIKVETLDSELKTEIQSLEKSKRRSP